MENQTQTQLIDSKEAMNIIGCSKGAFSKYISRRHIKVAKKSQGKNYFCPESIREFVPPNPVQRGPSIPGQPKTGFNTFEMRDVIDRWKVATYDTGSADVQIGMYTDKIKQIEIDMRGAARDTAQFYNMRKSMVRYLCERRRLLNYLQQTDFRRYRKAMQLIEKN